MKAFRFNLQRVLEWREMQVKAAEEKLSQLQHQLTSFQQQEVSLRNGFDMAEKQALAQPTMSGADLHTLAGFRESTFKQIKALQVKQQEYSVLVADQRERMIKVRRDFKVLEKLKEQRRRSWNYLNDRELEETAAEVFLANWTRSETDPTEGNK